VLLDSNEFAYSQGSAIALSGLNILDEILIIGNKFKSWGSTTATPVIDTYAIVIDDQAVSDKGFGLITGNQFKNNASQGVGIAVGRINGLLIDGNHFRDCYVPVQVIDGTDIRIYGNKTEGTTSTNALTVTPSGAGIIEANINSWDKQPTRWAFPMFKAVLSASQTIGAGPTAITTGFGTEVYDEDNNFNPVTGAFVAPTTGFYKFDVCLTTTSGTTTGDVWKVYLRNNVSAEENGIIKTIVSGSGAQSFSFGAEFKMTQGDDVVCYVVRIGGSGTFTLTSDSTLNFICGRKSL